MRNVVLGLLLIGLTCSFTAGGGPLKPYADKKFTWYGVDFRLARFVGSKGFNNPEAIQKNFIPKWNTIVLEEQDKYDIKSALRIKDYGYKIEWMMEMNNEVDVASVIQNDSYSITAEKVKEHIKAFHGAEGNGIGIVFVVESFNKYDEKGYFWVTFFDESTKEVILTEKIGGAPGGLSFGNYWCGSIHDVIKQIKSSKQKKWFRKR